MGKIKLHTTEYVLDDKFIDSLDNLRKEAKLKSIERVLEEALSLYQWAVEKSKEGYIIAAINGAERKEIALEVDTSEKLLKGYHKGGKRKWD